MSKAKQCGRQKYKEIILRNGMKALVDTRDFDFINSVRWSAKRTGRRIYALRLRRWRGDISYMQMHRLIMKARKGQIVDHINGNGLDNRKSANLRFVTAVQNCMNHLGRLKKASGVRGVYRQAKGWRAEICVSGHVTNLGYFREKTDAIDARRKAEIKLYGKYRRK